MKKIFILLFISCLVYYSNAQSLKEHLKLLKNALPIQSQSETLTDTLHIRYALIKCYCTYKLKILDSTKVYFKETLTKKTINDSLDIFQKYYTEVYYDDWRIQRTRLDTIYSYIDYYVINNTVNFIKLSQIYTEYYSDWYNKKKKPYLDSYFIVRNDSIYEDFVGGDATYYKSYGCYEIGEILLKEIKEYLK